MDPDRLEQALIQAAARGETLSYRRALALYGRRVGPNNVRALMRVLTTVCDRTALRGEPDLACLVVRERDGLPGEGYFAAHARAGRYAGPASGPRAQAFLASEQERAFAFWAAAIPLAEAIDESFDRESR